MIISRFCYLHSVIWRTGITQSCSSYVVHAVNHSRVTLWQWPWTLIIVLTVSNWQIHTPEIISVCITSLSKFSTCQTLALSFVVELLPLVILMSSSEHFRSWSFRIRRQARTVQQGRLSHLPPRRPSSRWRSAKVTVAQPTPASS